MELEPGAWMSALRQFLVKPLLPPHTDRKDIMPTPNRLEIIDNHAVKAPKSVRSSVSSLAVYLAEPALTCVEKVRAFYRWTAHFISYDMSRYLGGATRNEDAQSVLQYGTATEDGYSNLFKALCDEVTIPCHVVQGFDKGLGYDPEVPYTVDTSPNHTWNIVYVDGEWRPLDVTWGAGHSDEKFEFVRDFTDFYFLLDPEYFIQSHFPCINKDLKTSEPYQLLETPVSLAHFNKGLKIYKSGIEWRFKSLSHQESVIDMADEMTVRVMVQHAPSNFLYCNLEDRKTDENIGQYVLVNKVQEGVYSIDVRTPHSGQYILDVCGMDAGCPWTLARYLINSSMANGQPFPEQYSSTYRAGCNLIEPRSHELPARLPIPFKMASEVVTRISISLSMKELTDADDDFIVLVKDAQNKNFDFILKTPRKGMTVKVLGKTDNEKSVQIYEFKTV